MLIYNRKDPLQMRFMQTLTSQTISPVNVHYLPSSIGLVEAAAQHMGWCMAAEDLIGAALNTGQVVNLAPDLWLDEPLYWQHAAVRVTRARSNYPCFYSASAASLHR
ncbi:hypothetical protein P4S72_13150 [Vibrio sp. PP-XX7]